jgi:hypothetical protein
LRRNVKALSAWRHQAEMRSFDDVEFGVVHGRGVANRVPVCDFEPKETSKPRKSIIYIRFL